MTVRIGGVRRSDVRPLVRVLAASGLTAGRSRVRIW